MITIKTAKEATQKNEWREMFLNEGFTAHYDNHYSLELEYPYDIMAGEDRDGSRYWIGLYDRSSFYRFDLHRSLLRFRALQTLEDFRRYYTTTGPSPASDEVDESVVSTPEEAIKAINSYKELAKSLPKVDVNQKLEPIILKVLKGRFNSVAHRSPTDAELSDLLSLVYKEPQSKLSDIITKYLFSKGDDIKRAMSPQDIKHLSNTVAMDILTAWYNSFGNADSYKIFEEKAKQYGLYEEITKE